MGNESVRPPPAPPLTQVPTAPSLAPDPEPAQTDPATTPHEGDSAPPRRDETIRELKPEK